MHPIIKWAGGKTGELPEIEHYLPAHMNRYIEPFVGGGAVALGLEKRPAIINDYSAELIDLYRCVATRDQNFFSWLERLYKEFRWIDSFVDTYTAELLSLYESESEADVVKFIGEHEKAFSDILEILPTFRRELKKNLSSKIKRSHKLEASVQKISDSDRVDNLESAIKSAFYMAVRSRYNDPTNLLPEVQTANFYFVREYCYSSMFRYNAAGEFNVPYGGVSYNRKNFGAKIEYLRSKELVSYLQDAKIYQLDFEEFLKKVSPQKDDFIFLDPPYDSDFSTYCNNPFDQDDQKRLRDCMAKTQANFMLVIKDTPYIRELYEDKFSIHEFSKNYMVSFKNRNKRDVNHLVITNY